MPSFGLRRALPLALAAGASLARPIAAQEPGSGEPLLTRLRQAAQHDWLAFGMLVQAVGDAQWTRRAPGPNGFSIPNARLRVSGRLDGGFAYLLQTNFAGSVAVLDARVGYHPVPEVGLEAGLFKVPFSRELLTYGGALDYVERAAVVNGLAPNRQRGIQLGGEFNGGRLEYAVGAFNGNRAGANDDNRVLGVVRVAVRPWGPAGGRHAEVAFNAARSRDRDGDVGLVPDFAGTRTLYGVDTRWEDGPWLLAGELTGATLDPVTGSTRTPHGWFAQVGRKLGRAGRHQLLLRWDGLRPDGLAPDHDLLLAGWNHWPTGAIKVQVNWVVDLDRAQPRYHRVLANLQFGV